MTDFEMKLHVFFLFFFFIFILTVWPWRNAFLFPPNKPLCTFHSYLPYDASKAAWLLHFIMQQTPPQTERRGIVKFYWSNCSDEALPAHVAAVESSGCAVSFQGIRRDLKGVTNQPVWGARAAGYRHGCCLVFIYCNRWPQTGGEPVLIW